jgi:hypothetical protein
MRDIFRKICIFGENMQHREEQETYFISQTTGPAD